MGCHGLPISDVSSAVVQGFYVVRLATGVLELAGLVHTKDPANSLEYSEPPVGKVLPRLPRRIIWGTFFDHHGADKFTTLLVGIF